MRRATKIQWPFAIAVSAADLLAKWSRRVECRRGGYKLSRGRKRYSTMLRTHSPGFQRGTSEAETSNLEV